MIFFTLFILLLLSIGRFLPRDANIIQLNERDKKYDIKMVKEKEREKRKKEKREEKEREVKKKHVKQK